MAPSSPGEGFKPWEEPSSKDIVLHPLKWCQEAQEGGGSRKKVQGGLGLCGNNLSQSICPRVLLGRGLLSHPQHPRRPFPALGLLSHLASSPRGCQPCHGWEGEPHLRCSPWTPLCIQGGPCVWGEAPIQNLELEFCANWMLFFWLQNNIVLVAKKPSFN